MAMSWRERRGTRRRDYGQVRARRAGRGMNLSPGRYVIADHVTLQRDIRLD
jgi:hypothetical protein